ncbi:unnamed protein product [Umbelopsis vinacea]
MGYQHPDLAEITKFLLDFGMVIAKQTEDKIWFRGYSTDQYVYYAQRGILLPGGSPIEELKEAPGGGHIVTVIDPSGFPVNFIHGQTAAPGEKAPAKLIVNHTDDKPRKRVFQRFEPGPAAFYVKNFNIVPTDYLYVEKDNEKHRLGVFAHIDRGEDFVDHHTFFLTAAGSNHVHHCSFEVQDFDTQQLGHQWLADKGYKSVWGVGRHILGSQIFDYWWDTTGNMIEHYADGDLVNNQTPINNCPTGHESLAVWGPELPQVFLI